MNLRLALFFFSHYGCLALLALISYLIGARLTRRISYHSAVEKFSFSTGLGLGVITYIVFAAGLLHLLSPFFLLAVFGLILIPLAGSLKQLWMDGARIWRGMPLRRRLWFGALVLLALPVLLLPLYPPTQWDATSYHLAAAKIYSRSHTLVGTPYLRYPVFPQLNEMLFTLMLSLYDDISAQLVQFLMMILVAVALYAWGRRVFTARAGLWSAALWLSNPLVLWLGKTAYIDMGLVLFVTLGAYAFFNWFQSRHTPWLLLSAALFGFGAGSKYLALFPIFCFGLVLLSLAVRERTTRPLLAFALLVIVTGAPWYLRNAWYTGNPIWPYWGSKLGYGSWTPDDASRQFDEQTSYGEGKGSLALLHLPWNLAFHTEIYHVDEHITLSPVYLFLLPLCLIAATGDSYLRALLVAAGLYTLFWFFSVQVLRYLLPAVPLLSLAAASAAEIFVFRLRRLRAPVFAPALSGAICILFLYVGLAPNADALTPKSLPPTTAKQRSAYLSQAFPAYSALEFLNRRKGDGYTLYALETSNLAYFADGRFMGDWFGPARYSLIQDLFPQPQQLYEELRGMKADYLLIDESQVMGNYISGSVHSPAFTERYFKMVYSAGHVLLFEVVH